MNARRFTSPCRAGCGNPHQAIPSHVDEDGVQKLDVIDSMGRTQQANHINGSVLSEKQNLQIAGFGPRGVTTTRAARRTGAGMSVRRFTSLLHAGYPCRVAEKEATGIGVLSEVAISHQAFLGGFFVALVRPVLGSRAGGALGLAVASAVRQLPFGLPTRLASGWRFIAATEDNTMIASTGALASVIPFPNPCPPPCHARSRGRNPKSVVSLSSARAARSVAAIPPRPATGIAPLVPGLDARTTEIVDLVVRRAVFEVFSMLESRHD